MIRSSDQIDEIFWSALQLACEEERRTYLERVCGPDQELRQLLEKLLRAQPKAAAFLEQPFVGPVVTVDESLTERPGMVIGPYKLLERIGEGGFGVVYMAEQQQPLRRKVALKVLKPGMDTRQVVARFEAERQALALMDHPHIAHVFDGGATASGRPYFVMELVRGFAITAFCDQHQLTPRRRLELFLSVCQAVQHAHHKGIIHRDLKPSNILVTLHDGVPVAKVIDFGIAKALAQQLTDKTLFTNFAQLIGTPLYMSPEQAEMSGLDVDTRTDVYALGVLLYELLTGTTPFDRECLRTAGYDEIRRIIREEEPPRPSKRLSTLGETLTAVSAQRATDPKRLRQMFRGELDWIVMKALEKDRNRRYESASAFAADVRRHLADEPVQACPPSVWYRFRKLARRHRRALVPVAAFTLAALVGVGALAASAVRVWQANNDVWQANKDLREALDGERREGYFQRITVADRELNDNPAAAMRALGGCPEYLRGWEWHYLMRLSRFEPLVWQNRAEVNGVAFSPDGERLASAGGDGAVKVWNSRTGDAVRTIPHAHAGLVVAVAFHPDGKHLASIGGDRQIKVWDLTTGQEVFRQPCDAIRETDAAYAVAFRPPDGRHLAGGGDGVVSVWDWENGQLLHTFPGHDHHSISVAFSGDGQRMATGSGQEGPRIWDATTGAGPLHTFPGYRNPIGALAFSPDDRRLAVACFDRTVKVWDTTTGDLLFPALPHTGNVLCVAFSPDGRRLASAGEDKTVRLWDAHTGREVLGLRGHTGKCGCVAFSSDGRRLASASADGTIRLWDATPLRGDQGQEVLTFTQHRDEIRSVAFSPDGRWIASAGLGKDVKVWDAATGDVSTEFNGDTSRIVFALAWHPDGQRLAAAGHDGQLFTVKVWDVLNRREAFALLPGREYFAVAFSPDRHYLVTGRQKGAVQVWDAATGHEVVTLGRHDQSIRAVVFSRDGKFLATASQDGEVKLWDATRLGEKQEGRCLTHRARIPGPSVNVAFSPDGRRLATGGERNTVKIWDVQTGQERQTLWGHGGEVYTLAFSPDDDGRWVASGGEDSTVKVWDSHTGKVVGTFRGHTGLVSSVAFSPDGRRLVSGSRDRTVKVWDLTSLRAALER
jgi:WD40 repeat protein/serine/threonine protein kinase